MKKKTLFFIIINFSLINSYTQVVGYNFRNINSELKYELILSENGNSEWRMIVNARGDSIDSEDFSKSVFNYNNSYYLTDKTISKKVEVIDEPEMIWTTGSTEKTEILGYDCLTATTTFRGRSYKAYYTVNDKHRFGPWKFNGLNGMILKIESDDGLYSFDATEIKLDEEKFNSKKLDAFINQNTFYNWAEYEEIYLLDIADFINEQKCNCEYDGSNTLKISKIEKIYPELHDEGIFY